MQSDLLIESFSFNNEANYYYYQKAASCDCLFFNVECYLRNH